MKHRIKWIFRIIFSMVWLFSACTNQLTEPTVAPTKAEPGVPTDMPWPTNTPQPTPIPLVTPTIESDLLGKNPVPPELLASQAEAKNDKLIAFVNGDYERYGDSHRDIFVMNFDGSNIRNLTNNAADDWGPVWSPDGKKILFFSDRNHCTGDNCELELFVMNADGTGSRKVFQSQFSSIGISWAPDLKHLTLVHEFWDPRPLVVGCCRREDYYGDALRDVFLVNINDSYARNVTGKLQPGGFHTVTWSPNGKYFVFLSVYTLDDTLPDGGDWTYNLYLANANGSNLKKLPGGPFQRGSISAKAWSPDSKRLAFLTAKGIAIINADGSNFLEYPFEQNPGGREVFWLDNQHLAFTDSRGNFYKISTDFTDRENLTFSSENEKLAYLFQISKAQTIYYSNHSHEIWQVASTWSRLAVFYEINPKVKIISPDSKWIAYITDDGTSQIRVISTETFVDYFVIDKAGSDLFWSPDSRQIIFTKSIVDGTTNTAYQSLFAINLDGTNLHQIGDNSLKYVWKPAIQP